VNAKHTVVVDWDGTAVPSCWPGRPTTFLPGFVENMFRLHRAGIHLLIHSARLTPFDPITSMAKSPAAVAEEVQYVRSTLDSAGLTFIDIWVKPGKPQGSAYVDDKAERYHGCRRCWDKVTDKILLRLGREEAVFPPFNQGASE
jgi:hypothetical protein